ncbi:major capsid protein [Paenibacillus sp. NRS-1760]|uniref:major capsid protein n=1 Tax=Paenibacillus sp. NRS-1760 TaxID=3233902 RepID=UPI003D2B9541
MTQEIDIYDPRVLIDVVMNRPPVRTFLRDMFFKPENIQTFDTSHVDVDYMKSRRRMAPFVSPRLKGKTMSREGLVTKTYQPPQIKPDRPITLDNLNKRIAGDTIYTRRSPADRASIILARDILDLDDAITRREEWMFAQILFSGSVHMIGEGVDEILDFQFSQKEVLSGTDKWDNAASDPYTFLHNRRQTVVKNSGINPNILVLSSDVVPVFISHPKIKDLLDKRAIEIGRIDPRILPNGATYIGSLTALGLDIYSYDEWYLDEETDPQNATEKPMVPAGTIMLGSTNAQFKTYYGAVTLVDPDTKKFFTVEGDRIPQSWVTIDPPSRTLQLNARPLPVPHEVDSWFVSKVL